jgi:hypothetical protein
MNQKDYTRGIRLRAEFQYGPDQPESKRELEADEYQRLLAAEAIRNDAKLFKSGGNPLSLGEWAVTFPNTAGKMAANWRAWRAAR